jgi:hypothetical protein
MHSRGRGGLRVPRATSPESGAERARQGSQRHSFLQSGLPFKPMHAL